MRFGLSDSGFFLLLALVAFVAGQVSDSPIAMGGAFALTLIGFASLGQEVSAKRDPKTPSQLQD